MTDAFSRWGLTAEEAELARLSVVEDASAVHPSYPAEPAVVIPYFLPSGEPLIVDDTPFTRIRRLRVTGDRRRREPKYLQPPGTGVQIYFPPLGNWLDVFRDSRVPIIITEGEAKAVVASLRVAPTIALGGVYSFTGSNGQLHPALQEIVWANRDVFLIYDSDAAYNTQVAAAESRLADELFFRRRARLRVVRLPPGQDNAKIGLDDYLRLFGAESLRALMQGTPPLSAADGRVLALNENLVWVEYERLAFDIKSRIWLNKESLVSGSKYSAETVVSPNPTSRTVTRKSVAKMWLTHPLARRVDEVLFRPGDDMYVAGEHARVALNLWEPLPLVAGPVEPFLDLTAHLVSQSPPAVRDLPLKLLAYKVQNPQAKIPLALVLLGGQGTGKTLWTDIIREAFGPYGTPLNPRTLASDFQGWLETSLIATVNEMSPRDLLAAREKLKSLISDLRQPMNEKYRPARNVNSYTFYIITSNRRGVGAYEFDDRRMIVIDAPPKREAEFYQRIADWKNAGGPQWLYAWLMGLDLEGWTPPQEAPLTPEKYMAYVESLTPVQRLAEDMRTAGGPIIVKTWLDRAIMWAESVEVSQNLRLAGMARAVLDNIRQYQIRPWYTAEELATIFPHIAIQFMGSEAGSPSPGQLSQELRESGIPYLVNRDDPRGFRWRGRLAQFLVVADFDRWREPITQAEFEEYMRSWPTYGDLTKSA